MNAEDQELLNRLKEKYAGAQAANENVRGRARSRLDDELTNAQASSFKFDEYAPPVAPGGATFNMDVKICTVCHGSGVKTEEYNHRRLEVGGRPLHAK